MPLSLELPLFHETFAQHQSCDRGLGLMTSQSEQQDAEDPSNQFSGRFMDETLVFGVSKVNHFVRRGHVEQ